MLQRLRRPLLCLIATLASYAPLAAGEGLDIAHENRQKGSTAWQIQRPAMEREVEGYADQTSVPRGGTIRFFVNTASPSFTLQVFRMGWYAGLGGRAVTQPLRYPPAHEALHRQPPCSAPTNDPTTSVVECAWRNPIALPVADDWTSGVYLVKLTAGGKGPATGRESYITFVVRDDASKATHLMQIPVTTYQAYNNWGGQSIYQHNTACNIVCTAGACPCTNPKVAQSSIVSFERPYGVYVADRFARSGPPGYPTNPWNGKPINPDNTIGAGLLFEWDLNLIRWLEREGYDLSYTTNLDTDADRAGLRAHQSFLSVGHDEFWSTASLCNVIAARDAGIQIGFLGENTAFKHVAFEPATGGQPRRRMHELLPRLEFAKISCDPASDVTYNRSSLVGLSSAHFPVEAPLVVRNTTSPTGQWVYRGSGLHDGDEVPWLLGYEAEFPAPFAAGDPQHLDYTLLALSSPTFAGKGPICTPPSTQGCAAMTAYRAASGAQVVSTGSMFWPWALDAYNANPTGLETGVLAGVIAPSSFSYDKAARLNPRIAQVTMNILERLAPASKPHCGDASLDFRVEPDAKGSSARWPGGATSKYTSRQTSATPECGVTIHGPSGVVTDPKVTPVAGFAITQIDGFAHCVGVGGPTGDGCAVDCEAATAAACTGERASCGAIAAATYHVECHDH